MRNGSYEVEAEQGREWLEKALLMIDHFRDSSQSILSYPEMSVFLDEQMIRCLERSPETHRIKNRHIRELFKFRLLWNWELDILYNLFPTLGWL